MTVNHDVHSQEIVFEAQQAGLVAVLLAFSEHQQLVVARAAATSPLLPPPRKILHMQQRNWQVSRAFFIQPDLLYGLRYEGFKLCKPEKQARLHNFLGV